MADGTDLTPIVKANGRINSREYWEGRFSRDWGEKDGAGQSRFFAELLLDSLPEWLVADIRRHNMTICDWGCAEGEAVGHLGQTFADQVVHGVDFSETAVSHARTKYPEYEFFVHDWLSQAESLPSYDVIVSSNTLEHFREPLRILRNILGRAARRHVILLIPFEEDLERMESEHFFRFFASGLPLSWPGWICTVFRVHDTAAIPGTRWRGQQAAVVYTAQNWMEEGRLQISLASLPGQAVSLKSRTAKLQRELENANAATQIVQQKLETQLIHDRMLSDSNKRLATQNEQVNSAYRDALERVRHRDDECQNLSQQKSLAERREQQAQAENAEVHKRREAEETQHAQRERQFQAELAELQRQSEAEQAQHAQRERRFQAELAERQQRLEAAEAQHAQRERQLGADIKAFSDRSDRLEIQKKAIASQVKQLQDELEELKARNDDLLRQLNNAQEMQQRQETHIAELKQANVQLERSIEVAHSSNLSLEHRLQETQQNLGDTLSRYQRLKKKWYSRVFAEISRFRKKVRRKLGLDKPLGHAPSGAQPRPINESAAPATEPAPRVIAAPMKLSVDARSPQASGLSQRKLQVGAILDTFTHDCLEPECNLVTFTPSNWEQILEEAEIDLLFVESAWQGNNGAWNYRIGKYNAQPDDELDRLLAWASKRDIPAVFWNKEDPPNYDRFIENAAKFDYIFTTDADCIGRYREYCGHDRIAPLPFAAQPAIHNPLLTRPRDRSLCFAGTYYADCFERRRRDMETLLRVGSEFDLDIYDRMHGNQAADAARFSFPQEFQPYIRGKLAYEEMVQAYRGYKVFLNVNSVYESPTMFSRRVFELLASGTPVVSTYSLGIQLMFGEMIPLLQDEDQFRSELERLLQPEQWRRCSAQGVRLVMAEHTYEKRLKTVSEAVGLVAGPQRTSPLVAVVVPDGAGGPIGSCLSRQTDTPDAVWVVETGSGATDFVREFKEQGVACTSCPADQLLTRLQTHFPEGQVAFLNAQHFYGPGYLKDARLALRYTDCGMTGMTTFFACGEGRQLRLDEGLGEEHFLRKTLLSATVVATTASLDSDLLKTILHKDEVTLPVPGYARSRFEFIRDYAAGSDHEIIRQVVLEASKGSSQWREAA